MNPPTAVLAPILYVRPHSIRRKQQPKLLWAHWQRWNLPLSRSRKSNNAAWNYYLNYRIGTASQNQQSRLPLITASLTNAELYKFEACVHLAYSLFQWSRYVSPISLGPKWIFFFFCLERFFHIDNSVRNEYIRQIHRLGALIPPHSFEVVIES